MKATVKVVVKVDLAACIYVVWLIVQHFVTEDLAALRRRQLPDALLKISFNESRLNSTGH